MALQYAGNYHIFEGRYLDAVLNNNVVHRNFLFFAFPFFYIGYQIRRTNLNTRLSWGQVWLWLGAGAVLMAGEVAFNFHELRQEAGFDNYLSLIVACPAIFILFSRLNIRGDSKFISSFASAIYFSHIYFYILLSRNFELNSLQTTGICLLSSMAASAALVVINRRSGGYLL